MIITKRDLMRIVKEEVERARRLEKIREARRARSLEHPRRPARRVVREGGMGSGRLPGDLEWEDVDTPRGRGRPSHASLRAEAGAGEIASEFWYMLLDDLVNGNEPPQSVFARATDKLAGKGRPSDDDVAGASMVSQELEASGAPGLGRKLLAMISKESGPTSRGRPRTYRGGL